MRLWHKDLIPILPRQQLLGQWRECCLIAKNIAEKGTPNHVLVNKVLYCGPDEFNTYTMWIWAEMEKRGYNVQWIRFEKWRKIKEIIMPMESLFEGWHNDRYLKQCLANLQEKHDCGAIPEEEWKKITDRYPEWK